MPTLREVASNYQKKDLTAIKELILDKIEVKEDTFEKNGKPMKYNYIEIDSWKYSINTNQLQQIKDIIEVRPQTTKIRFVKRSSDGLVVPVAMD